MDDKDIIFSTVKKRYQHTVLIPKVKVKDIQCVGIDRERERPTIITDALKVINKTDHDIYCIDKMGLFHSAYKPDKRITNYITIEKEIFFDRRNNSNRYFSMLNKIGNIANLKLEKMTNNELVMLNYIYYCTITNEIIRLRDTKRTYGNGGVMDKGRFDDTQYHTSKLNPIVKPAEMISTIEQGIYNNPGSLIMTLEFKIHIDELNKYGGIVYLKELGIVLTLHEDLAVSENHPDCSELNYILDSEDKMKLNGHIVYIIDKNDAIGEKFMVVNDSVLRLKASTEYTGDLPDGLYIEDLARVDPNNPMSGEFTNRKYYSPEEIKELDFVFSNYHDAFASDNYLKVIKNRDAMIELERKKADLEIQIKKQEAMLIKNKLDIESYNRDAELHKIKYDIEKTKTLTTGTKGIVDLCGSIFSILGLFIPGLGKLFR